MASSPNIPPSSPFSPGPAHHQQTPLHSHPRTHSRASTPSNRSVSPALHRNQSPFSPTPYRLGSSTSTPHHHYHHTNQQLYPPVPPPGVRDEFGLDNLTDGEDDEMNDDNEDMSSVGVGERVVEQDQEHDEEEGGSTGGGVFIDRRGSSRRTSAGTTEAGGRGVFIEESEDEEHYHGGGNDLMDVDGHTEDISGFSEFDEDGPTMRGIREGLVAGSGNSLRAVTPETGRRLSSGRPYTPTKLGPGTPQHQQGQSSPSHFQQRNASRQGGHSRTSSRSSMISNHHLQTPSAGVGNTTINLLGSSPAATPIKSHQHHPPLSTSTLPTNPLLDDFTMQFNAVNQPRSVSSGGLFSPSSGNTTPRPIHSVGSRSDSVSTPIRRPHSASTSSASNQPQNLLDFDIPPPPTPRSIPTITLRELETLKSTYLTQLAELKSQLMGKDAEVTGLRNSLLDAESRCGALREEVDSLANELAESDNRMESFREGVGRQVEAEREGWERERQGLKEEMEKARKGWERELGEVRGVCDEMERLLGEGGVREEGFKREIEGLKGEVEHMRSQIQALQSQQGVAQPVGECNRCAGKQIAGEATGGGGGGSGDVNKEEVDRIAKELHVLYKAKHEAKVTALKKSYELRWEKKIRSLEAEITRLKSTQNLPSSSSSSFSSNDDANNNGRIEEMRQLKEKLDQVNLMVERIKKENESLRKEVERERREKGDLVGAVEEMLALQMQTLKEAATEAAVEEEQIQKLMPQVPGTPGTPGGGQAGRAKPGTLKVKDVKKLERGWEGVRRRASGIGLIPLPANKDASGGGISGIAPPRASAAPARSMGGVGGGDGDGGVNHERETETRRSGIGRGGFGVPAGGLRGGIERMGRGAAGTRER